ncbi:CD63 antigen-like [Ruditapes philippinarum]|uniref:CD63 antigen-like n=1 Tax=Ruditapes philippinarum TaxID=129788 RepID=UPI00295B22E5|nr:CD63 antigen-like [Ruditapes philippinarum]
MSSSRISLCFRILTIILGVLLLLIGAAILGFSIYLRVDYWLNQYAAASEELTKYTVAVYIFIATGAIVVLFCIIGIYGAIRPDKCAIIVYMVFLPIILGMMIGGGVYAYVYREEIENTIKNSDLLKEVVEKKYGIDGRVTQAIDFMQKELECCGGMSYTDYKQSVWSQDYDANSEQNARKDQAPKTCCKDYKLYEDTNTLPYKYCPMYKTTAGSEGDKLPPTNDNIHKKGCGEAFVALMQENVKIAAAIAFSIVAVLVFAIAFCALLLFFMRKSPPLREDDVVYEMARTQEKSPYPARGGPYANLYQS